MEYSQILPVLEILLFLFLNLNIYSKTIKILKNQN